MLCIENYARNKYKNSCQKIVGFGTGYETIASLVYKWIEKNVLKTYVVNNYFLRKSSAHLL